MLLGYAIIQLPELVTSLFLYAKSRMIKKQKLSSAKSVVTDRTKNLHLLRPGNEMTRNEKNIENEVNLFKLSNDRISVGRFLQLEVKVSSVMERVDTFESKLEDVEKKLNKLLALNQAT